MSFGWGKGAEVSLLGCLFLENPNRRRLLPFHISWNGRPSRKEREEGRDIGGERKIGNNGRLRKEERSLPRGRRKSLLEMADWQRRREKEAFILLLLLHPNTIGFPHSPSLILQLDERRGEALRGVK